MAEFMNRKILAYPRTRPKTRPIPIPNLETETEIKTETPSSMLKRNANVFSQQVWQSLRNEKLLACHQSVNYSTKKGRKLKN